MRPFCKYIKEKLRFAPFRIIIQTYKYSNIYFDTNEAKTLLAGDYHFKTEEIEVYRHVLDLDI